MLNKRGLEFSCSFCGAFPNNSCVSDRGRIREYPHKVRWTNNPVKVMLEEVGRQEYERKLYDKLVKAIKEEPHSHPVFHWWWEGPNSRCIICIALLELEKK